LLRHFDFKLPRIVHVDSSGYAIAAFLSQPGLDGKLHPVIFYSMKLLDWERGWPIFDLELIAVVMAFEQWRAWLMGTVEPIKVFSDHSNLHYFCTAKQLSPKQARWASFLDEFNFEIHHISGKHNPADGPSRRPAYTFAQLKNSPTETIAKRLVSEDVNDLVPLEAEKVTVKHDLFFQKRTVELINNLKRLYANLTEDEIEDLQLFQDMYWYQDQIYVPMEMRTRIIQLSHDTLLAGHPGITQTLALLTQTFSWPGVRKDVIKFLKLVIHVKEVRPDIKDLKDT
jgi:hypothetical protein